MYTPKTLKLFGTGQVTIPKALRDEYDTNSFKAIQTKEGILLVPIKVTETELVFDPPMPVDEFLSIVRDYRKEHDGI